MKANSCIHLLLMSLCFACPRCALVFVFSLLVCYLAENPVQKHRPAKIVTGLFKAASTLDSSSNLFTFLFLIVFLLQTTKQLFFPERYSFPVKTFKLPQQPVAVVEMNGHAQTCERLHQKKCHVSAL